MKAGQRSRASAESLRAAIDAALDAGDHQLAGELLEVIRRRAPAAPVVDLGAERARRRSR